MVEINVDLKDVSPLGNFPKGPRSPSSPRPAEGNGEFSEILSKRIKQEPAPILTPNDLLESVAPSLVAPQNTPRPMTAPQPVELAVPDLQSTPKTESAPVEASPINPPLSLQDLLNRNHVMNDSAEPIKTPETESPDQFQKSDAQDNLDPIILSYTVKRGDTLSDIIAAQLKEQGVAFDAPSLYRRVNAVAAANGIRNPNLIYPGQNVDLSPMLQELNPGADGKPDLLAAAQDMQAPAHGQITSRFGMRDHPILDGERFHAGVDISLPIGSPVQPVKAGEVVFSGIKNGYGMMVEIDHGDGATSRYGHLSELLVKKGDVVTPGQSIALSGETGLATGPHLHLEIRQGGRPIDPLTIISQETIESGALDESKVIARGAAPKPDA
ncbi:MAG: LysM peptidoglycan-binding domain-containing M23 family metallopeptidase [Candidatus Omnitrophota bacterium]